MKLVLYLLVLSFLLKNGSTTSRAFNKKFDNFDNEENSLPNLQSKVAKVRSGSICCCSVVKLRERGLTIRTKRPTVSFRTCPYPSDYEFVSFYSIMFYSKNIYTNTYLLITLKKFFCNTFSLMQSIQEKNVILELLEL